MNYEPPTREDWDRLNEYIGKTVLLQESQWSRIKGDRQAVLLDVRIDTSDTDNPRFGRNRFTHDLAYLGERKAWLCATVRFYGSDRVDYRINAHALRDAQTRELIAPLVPHSHTWFHQHDSSTGSRDVCECGMTRWCSCERRTTPVGPVAGEHFLTQAEAERRLDEARRVLEEHGYTVTKVVPDGQHRHSQTDVPEEQS